MLREPVLAAYFETFCNKVAAAGFPYYLLPQATVTHYETLAITGDML